MYGMYKRPRYNSGARKYGLAKYKAYGGAPAIRKRPQYRNSSFYTPPYARLPLFRNVVADQPTIKYAKLTYVVHENLTGPTAGNIVVKEYRINGMYDPEVSVGGHQPMGFDELMNQYEKFTVLKAKFELENQSVVTYKNLFLMLFREQTPGAASTMYASNGLSNLIESAGSSETLCVTTGEYQARQRKVTMWADMSRFTGKTYRDLIGDYGYQGDSGHDPDQQQYMAVVLFNPQASDQSANTAQYQLKITYYAAFTKRLPSVSS